MNVHDRARQDVDSMQIQGGVLGDIKVESEFVGYDQLQVEAQSCGDCERWRVNNGST